MTAIASAPPISESSFIANLEAAENNTLKNTKYLLYSSKLKNIFIYDSFDNAAVVFPLYPESKKTVQVQLSRNVTQD
jgi:hypothetical protein